MPTSDICALSPPLLSAQHGPPKTQSDHKAVSIAQLSNDTQPPHTSHALNSTAPDQIMLAALPQSTVPTGMSPPLHSTTTTYPPNPTNHPTSNTPLPLMDTPSSHTQLSSLVQIIPTFDYLIPHWSPLILNSCKSMEDTLRHWTHHTTQYLHYHTLAYTLNTLGPHEHYSPDQWYTHTQVIEQSLLPFLSQTLSMFQTILTPILQRLHPTLNHLTQTLPTVASSATPLHSLRLHTSASLNYLTYTLLSQREQYNAPICSQSGHPMHASCAQPEVSPPICTQCYAIPLDLTDI